MRPKTGNWRCPVGPALDDEDVPFEFAGADERPEDLLKK
jgi:hypothetical protein